MQCVQPNQCSKYFKVDAKPQDIKQKNSNLFRTNKASGEKNYYFLR